LQSKWGIKDAFTLNTKLAGLVLFLSLGTAIQALAVADVPLEPIYFEPPVIERNAQIEQLSCVGLDNTIRNMQPYRYSYREPFYGDNTNKVVAAMVTMDFGLILQGLAGVACLWYSATVEEKEQSRMLLVEQRTALLQQLKAEKQCFE